jgi:hypothetical protein
MPPRRAVEARHLIQRILAEGGAIVPVRHALQRQGQRAVTMGDVLNVLRAGTVDEAEEENGAYRYRVRTPLIAVIIELPEDDVTEPAEAEITVITVMRLQ